MTQRFRHDRFGQSRRRTKLTLEFNLLRSKIQSYAKCCVWSTTEFPVAYTHKDELSG